MKEKSKPTDQETTDLFKLVFENSSIGKSLTSLDGFIQVNQAFAGMLGYTIPELNNLKWQDLTHPDDIPATQDMVARLLGGDMVTDKMEKRYLHKNGSILWAEIQVFLQRDTDNNPLFFITDIFNITNRKRIEQEIAQSQQLLKTITAEVEAVIFALDAGGIFTFSDGKGLQKLGLKPGEVVGLRAVEVYKDFPEIVDAINKTLAGERVKSVRLTLGNVKFDTTYQPIFDENGHVVRIVGLAIDVTEACKVEDVLRQSESRYRSLFEHNDSVMLLIDPETSEIKDANPAACNYYGWTHAEMCLKKISDINTLQQQKVLAEMKNARIEKRKHFFFKHRLANGMIRDVEVYSSPIYYGNTTLLYSIIHDITDRRQAEAALYDALETLETRVAQRTRELSRIIQRLDETGRIAKVGGWELELSTGKNTWSEMTKLIHEVEPDFEPHLDTAINFYSPESVPVITRLVERLINHGEPFDTELELITAKKHRIWVRAIGKAYWENGKIVRIGGMFQDINEKKMTDLALKKSHDHLEELVRELELKNKELEQFTFITSHDLQEPLLTLTNCTKLIQEEYTGKLDGDGDKAIAYIAASALRMRTLVKGLLDYSLLGKDPVIANLDFHEIVSSVVSELADVIKANIAQISIHDLPVLKGNEKDLRILVRNLLLNAIKFRKNENHPVINISARLQGNEWIFSFEDNGIGIQEKNREKVFSLFKRLHNRNEYGGIGIGLALCKKIADLHGGKIWIEGNQAGGSTFRFSIPNMEELLSLQSQTFKQP